MTESGTARRIRIGISACLLGQRVRYDGGHKWDGSLVEALGRHFSWVPVCPEVEYGLPVPREPIRLVGDPAAPRLVSVHTGIDHTEGMRSWAAGRLAELAGESLCGFIFKSGSPSSGMRAVKVYVSGSTPVERGVGIFAAAFMARFPLLPVEEERSLQEPALRENFITRAFVYRRWQALMAGRPGFEDLEGFHRDHQQLVMSHPDGRLAILERLAANEEQLPFDQAAAAYLRALLAGIKGTVLDSPTEANRH
ncbi:MAG: DUF523 and DUF1722 domain-containing protein [Pseudomonadota bacterium]|nr:DUF523 and DUF1722 domain-containing protein [Pseudomonadota bacterium]